MTTRPRHPRRPRRLVFLAAALTALVIAPGGAVGSPLPAGPSAPRPGNPERPARPDLAVHSETARSLGRVNLRVAAKEPRPPRANPRLRQLPRLSWDRPNAGAVSPAVGPVGGALASAAVAVSDTPPAPATGVGQASGFAGMSDLVNDTFLDCGGSRPCVEPPDSWIAAGPDDLVQMVNIHTRVTDRAGSDLLLVDNSTLFDIPTTEYWNGDPRMLYVPERDRWIASIFSIGCVSSGDTYFPFGHLYLAVSTTGHPTGSWDRYVIDFPGAIPDYPGLGYGSATVALSANEFAMTACSGPVPIIDEQGYLGASLHVVDWTDLLDGDGTAVFAATSPDSALFDWRPAPNLVADPTIHALVEMGTPAAPSLGHATISGTIAGGDLAMTAPTDLALAAGLGLVAPPAPRDRGGSIPKAVDERVTDAVRLGNRLAYVHTAACGSGTSLRDCVRVTELDVSGEAPTVAQSLLVDAAGTDTFMGGVGFSNDGTLYVVYSRSSTTTYVSSYARWQRATDARGAFGPGTALLAAGKGAYGGLTGNTRWGDYVGVARDPADPAAVWQADQYADTDGGWATWVSRLGEDATPPVVSSPSPGLASGGTIGSTIPVTVSWTAADPGSGISSTSLQLSKNGGPFTSVSLAGPTATSAKLNLAPGTTSYTLRACATDGAANVACVTRASFRVLLYQETSSRISYAGTWKMAYGAAYSGGRERYAKTAGRRATLSTSAFAFAWVASYGPRRGSARVVVDGTTIATYNLHRASTHHRRVISARNFGASGTHTFGITVLGTARHSRVDVDAFVVLR